MTASAEPAKKAPGLRDTIAALGRPRVGSMFVLGFSSGLPFMLTGGTFGYWLRDEGTTLTAIGFLSWVGLAYTFKVFWAPLMDRAPAPLFGRLGQRRGWAVFAQALVALGLLGMAAVGAHGPGGIATIGAFALVVAFASATQDAAVDAWRIEFATDPDDLGVLTSAFQLGYRIALLVADALILIMAQKIGWSPSYVVMALLMGGGLLAALRTPEPVRADAAAERARATEAGDIAPSSLRSGIGAALFLLAATWMYWMTHGGLAPPKGDPAHAAILALLFGATFGLFAFASGLRAGLSALLGGATAVVAAALTWWASQADSADALNAGVAGAFGLAYAVLFAAFAAACFLRAPLVWAAGALAVASVVLCAFYSAVTGADLIGGAHIFWPTVTCIAASALIAPQRIFSALVGPFVAFFRAHGWFAAVMLLMISLYRLPEFVIGPVAGPFYHDLGFEKVTVGALRGSAGFVGATLGIALGGLCVLRFGLQRSLIVGAILQGLGVAAYAVLAYNKPGIPLFSLVMAGDNFAYAFAGVAFVAYMSNLTSIGYTATQYALMSSTYTLFGKVLKGFSGAVVDHFQQTHTLMQSYGLFYLGAGAIGVPGLLLCLWISARQGEKLRAVSAPA